MSCRYPDQGKGKQIAGGLTNQFIPFVTQNTLQGRARPSDEPALDYRDGNEIMIQDGNSLATKQPPAKAGGFE